MEDRLSTEDLYKLFYQQRNLGKIFYPEKTSGWYFNHRSPVEDILSIEDLWKILCLRYSVYRMHVEEPISIDYLWKVFYPQKTYGRYFIHKTLVKGGLFPEVL